ncbi:nitroreductase/quinone reductase family protein [Kitasatospora sp. NBC_01246]|uniref:nitroreductase/quinone reductase family protein n=1 Tax=Kitasatospora sp. NBC_01246 TaxID=2903570 RepID=UPI003FA52B0B
MPGPGPVSAERAAARPLMAEHWPAYEEYQAKNDREIPVVVIEPTAFGRPPGARPGGPARRRRPAGTVPSRR